MGAPPNWLARLAKTFGMQQPGADAPVQQPATVRPGTAILKPKGAPKPQGREITLKANGELGAPAAPRRPVHPHVKQLTPAAMVYALAAGILMTLAIYNLFHGNIFNGLVTMIPAGSLAVLAYKYIQ